MVTWCQDEGMMGKLARYYLTSPEQSDRVQHSPVPHCGLQQPAPRHPRLSLRFLASYRLHFSLFLCLVIGSTLSLNPLTSFVLTLTLWFLYGVVWALCSDFTKPHQA